MILSFTVKNYKNVDELSIDFKAKAIKGLGHNIFKDNILSSLGVFGVDDKKDLIIDAIEKFQYIILNSIYWFEDPFNNTLNQSIIHDICSTQYQISLLIDNIQYDYIFCYDINGVSFEKLSERRPNQRPYVLFEKDRNGTKYSKNLFKEGSENSHLGKHQLLLSDYAWKDSKISKYIINEIKSIAFVKNISNIQNNLRDMNNNLICIRNLSSLNHITVSKNFIELVRFNNIQLLFTSYDANLIDFDFLRRDQVLIFNSSNNSLSTVSELYEDNTRTHKIRSDRFLRDKFIHGITNFCVKL